jgi:hypothetical protein
MALSPRLLSLIQKAGAAVFNADAALKESVAESAKKVSDAVTKNPFNAIDDSLYVSWKSTARISQAMSVIEAELKGLYALASDLPAFKRVAIALPAPSSSNASSMLESLEVIQAIDVTDVVAKRGPRKLKAAGKQGRSVIKKSTKGTSARKGRSGGLDNTAKVLGHLQTVLNAQFFAKLNQSSVAAAIGLPKGSIGASIKKLLQDGKLVQGEGKAFKLASAD